MYNKINTINKTNGFHLVSGKLYTFLNDIEKLCEFDNRGQLLWQTKKSDIFYRYHVTPQRILFYLDSTNNELVILHREMKQLLKIEKINLNLTNSRCYSGNILYSFEKEHILAFDIKNLSLTKKIEGSIEGRVFIIDETRVVTKKNSCIYVYNKTDFSVLWQKDFSTLAEYTEVDGVKEKGIIRQVWNYNDQIMILTQMFIFKLNCETGEIIQHKQLPAGFMELCVNDNIAYGCYGYHFIEIELDALDILNFQRMEYENYEGKELFTLMNKAVYHQGLVFHAVRLEGGLHCVGAIQPKTGERIWLHPLGVNDINSISFHNNNMFVHDIGSTLHIFERSTNP